VKSSISKIKNISEFYKKLNLDENILSKSQKKFLNNEGYLIIPPTAYIKKNLKKQTINELNKELRYFLAVRDNDLTQKEMSIGPGSEYRKRFGTDNKVMKTKKLNKFNT
jgi:hypothetical protein